MPHRRTALRVPLEDAKEKIGERIEEGLRIADQPIRVQDALDAARREWRTWREYTQDLLRSLFTSGEIATEFADSTGPVAVGGLSLAEEAQEFRENCEETLRKLGSIKNRLEFYIDAEDQVSVADVVGVPRSRRVFVVHGRDDGAENAVARLLEKVGLEAVILHEQPNRGSRSLLEKLISNAEAAEYAVVALTADDVGALATEQDQLRPRARQNVVLELGYFLGRLGPDRVCAITDRGIEQPSDYGGIAYIPYDDGGAWQYKLAKELRVVWDDIDLNVV